VALGVAIAALAGHVRQAAEEASHAAPARAAPGMAAP
jgi:hypothetical protein